MNENHRNVVSAILELVLDTFQAIIYHPQQQDFRDFSAAKFGGFAPVHWFVFLLFSLNTSLD